MKKPTTARLLLALLLAFLIAACGGGGSGDPIIGDPPNENPPIVNPDPNDPPDNDDPPTANAGPNRVVALGYPVALNAAGSTGSTFEWSVQHPDTGSSSYSGLIASFTPQSPGTYQVTLTVNGEAQDIAQITVVNAFMRSYDLGGDDWGRSVAVLSDGYLLSGESNQPDSDSVNYQMSLLRTGLSGSIVSESYFGGDLLDEAWAMAVDEASDRVWLAGFLGEHLSGDFVEGTPYLMQSNLSGVQQDEWFFEGPGPQNQFQAVTPTSDGGLIMCGRSDAAPWATSQGQIVMYVVKLDEDGLVDPNFTTTVNGEDFDGKAYGGSDWQDCWAVVENDEGYLLAGYTDSFEDESGDGYLVQIDFDGNLIWEGTIGFPGVYDEIYDLVQVPGTPNDWYIAVGYTEVEDVEGDMYLVKFRYDHSLAEIEIAWDEIIGSDVWDEASAVIATHDNNFVVVGFSDPFPNGDADAYFIKFDTDGNILWERLYGGIGSVHAMSVAQTPDGGFVMGGDIESGNQILDMLLIKTDAQGRVPPVAKPFAPIARNEGTSFSFPAGDHFTAVRTVPGEARSLTFQAIGLPQGLTINPGTGLISGTLPQVSATRTLPITIIATGNEGWSAAETLSLTVNNTN